MQKVDFTDYRKNCKKFEQNLQKSAGEILRKCAVAFAKKASIYCPPNQGQNKIEKRFYTRPILYVPDEVKKHKREQDIEALRKGKLFKTEIIKKGKWVKNHYSKTIRGIKKYTKIRNRGLFRAMFGANLEFIRQTIPSNIRGLLNKSKNLLNLKKLNSITESKEENQYSKIRIDNNAYNNESYQNKAVREGDYNAQKVMKRLLKQKAKENVEL